MGNQPRTPAGSRLVRFKMGFYDGTRLFPKGHVCYVEDDLTLPPSAVILEGGVDDVDDDTDVHNPPAVKDAREAREATEARAKAAAEAAAAADNAPAAKKTASK